MGFKRGGVPRQLLMFIVGLCAVMGGGSLVWLAMVSNAYSESSRVAMDAVGALTRSYTLVEQVASAEDALQRLALTRDPELIQSAIKDIERRRTQVLALIDATGPTGKTIREEYDRLGAAERLVIEAVLKGDGAGANEQFMATAGPRYQSVRAAVGDYFVTVQQTTARTMDDNAAQGWWRTLIRLLLANAALGLFGAYLWWLRRDIAVQLGSLAARLQDAGGQLADTSAQVTSSSQSVSEGVNRQAASLEETSASIEEIGATAGQNAGHAEEAKVLAAEARSVAEAGHRDMQEMRAAMDAIKVSSGAIAGIIKTIDEIAFQTNLLALNAAVEAARAGQAGQGFAVVADEVRALAQRSATAARETASSVEAVIAKSDRGFEVSAKVGRSLEQIVARARDVDSLVAEIAEASNQQRAGLEQVSHAMADMEKVTQAGAATAEETAATVLELNAQTEALRDVVLQLHLLAGTPPTWRADERKPQPAVRTTLMPRHAG